MLLHALLSRRAGAATWVILTTPLGRARKLDYVTKHYYTTTGDLWNLFRVGGGKLASLSSSTASEVDNIVVTSVIEASAVSVASDRLQLEEVSADHIERKLDLPHHRAQEISHYLESEAGPSQC